MLSWIALQAGFKKLLHKRKFPVLLGGEHTVTAGALMGVARVLGRVGVIQFDAHADLRDPL